MADNLSQRVQQLQQQGYQNSQIVDILQRDGHDSSEIFDAINQAGVGDAGPQDLPPPPNFDGPQSNAFTQPLDDEDRATPQQPQPAPQSQPSQQQQPPSPTPAPSTPPQQSSSQHTTPPSNSSASGDVSTEEYVEAIIDEKWASLEEDIQKIVDWKNRSDQRIQQLSQEVSDLKDRFEKLHNALIGKIEKYDKNILEVGAEIKAMEKVFSKVLPKFTENVKQLNDITGELKGKSKK